MPTYTYVRGIHIAFMAKGLRFCPSQASSTHVDWSWLCVCVLIKWTGENWPWGVASFKHRAGTPSLRHKCLAKKSYLSSTDVGIQLMTWACVNHASGHLFLHCQSAWIFATTRFSHGFFGSLTKNRCHRIMLICSALHLPEVLVWFVPGACDTVWITRNELKGCWILRHQEKNTLKSF